MRVIGGRWRGLRLASAAGRSLRPSSDRLRETLFNILAHNEAYPSPADARFADVFAGTGAVGIEALSRGAAQVTFVENNPRHLAVLRANLARLPPEVEPGIQVLRADARHPPTAPHPFDILFFDPPYASGLAAPALEAFAGRGWTDSRSLAVVETDARDELGPLPGWAVVERRRIGRAALHFLRPALPQDS